MRMATQYVDDDDANGAVSQTRVVTGHLRISASPAKTDSWNIRTSIEKNGKLEKTKSNDENKGQIIAIVFFSFASFFDHLPPFFHQNAKRT